MRVAHRKLDDIVAEARPYPTYLLENAATGLCLFSSAFMGHNDVIHFLLEDVLTTCVDIDNARLTAMAELYPRTWDFVCDDAWEFAAAAADRGERWDVVSVDSGRGSPTERSMADLGVWCAVANSAVVATFEVGQTYTPPEGWSADMFRRNSEVSWLMLTRERPA